MHLPRRRTIFLALAVALTSCAPDSDGGPRDAGQRDSGGSTGGHGPTGTGGAVTGSGGDGSGGGGTGGVVGTGGNLGTGGTSVGTGGDGGGGGRAGSGGNAGGQGGVAGTGGVGGGGGAGASSTGGSSGTGGRGGATGGSGTAGASGGAGAGGHGGVGGSGGHGGAAGSGGATFNPCPAAPTACKIMPLGDSITYGAGSSAPEGGYRLPLFRNVLKANQLATFVGRISTGPSTVDGKPFPSKHEGYRGYTIAPGSGRQGISSLVDDAMTMFRPHIVLLMIGTNDVNLSFDLANAPMRLGALMDKILADGPQTLLVVARITPTKVDTTNARVSTYNDAIPALVQARASSGKHIVLVDMYAAFTANVNYKTALLNDDLHPNNAGYVVMADTWYAAIRAYLPNSAPPPIN